MCSLIKLILTVGIYITHHLQGVQPQDIIHGDIHPWPSRCLVENSFACPSTLQPGQELVCIDESWVCDLDGDCPENEDEDRSPGGVCHGKDNQGCPDNGSFWCKSDLMCIPIEWMCDGDKDCGDGSDEHTDNCTRVRHPIPCLPSEFQCDETFKCIPLSKLCDDNMDCDSGLDQTGCSSQNCLSANITCDKCVEVPMEGARCDCGEGKVWDKTSNSCTDLNECNYERFCDHQLKCSHSSDGYTCGCVDGYTLVDDKTCKAINVPEGPGQLLIADEWNIIVADLEGNHSKTYSDIGHVRGLNFRFSHGEICWIGHNSSTGKSSLLCGQTSDVTGSSHVIQVAVQLTTVEGFAYDWLQDNWYFTDPVLRRVTVCMSGGHYCVIVAGGEAAAFSLAFPRNIVLDPSEGFFYLTDWNTTVARIVRCDMDGSDCTVLVSKSLRKPSGITIDYANKHLYWSDMQLQVIERIDLSGDEETRRLIAMGVKVEHIYSLDVFENFLYMSNRSQNTVVRRHRYNYTAEEKTYPEKVTRPAQLHVYHKQRQPDGTNLCLAGACPDTNQVCVVGRTGEERKAECLCAAGFKLESGKCTALAECAGICVNNCSLAEETSTTLPEKCTLAVCPDKMSYCSLSQLCLPSSWWCNGQADCPNKEDEGMFCRYEQCLPTEFTCGTGRCVDITYKCDTHDDCGDNSDEVNCGTCKEDNLFQCEEDDHCIAKKFLCDGHPDCVNGSDESTQHCGSFREPMFPCTDGTEFTCNNSQCVAVTWLCDGDMDCADGSDESPERCAAHQRQCKQDEKACDSGDQCIPANWFCDLDPDCRDRSDELDIYCNGTHSCLSPNRRCAKDGTHVCLKPSQVCDGIADCDQGADEGGMCNAKLCTSKPCSEACYHTPEGFVCACGPGQKLGTDNRTCVAAVPVDKLCEQWGICGQRCELDDQAVHGYRCTCMDGFFLEPDAFTCKPLESDPVYVVFSNRHELRRVDIVSSNTVTLKSGLRNTIALDFYYKDNNAYLFWTDVMEDKIYTGKMMGNSLTDVVPIITSGLATTEGVAVDWVGENIYWVESNLDQIEVAKLDGTNRTTLIAGNMSSPRAIVVDPMEGWLFWTDWEGQNPRIERSSMSGAYRSIIHRISPTEGGGWPNGLTTDYDFKRLYWIDARSESIHSIKYDGTDHRLILKGNKFMSHPFALSLFGNYVYWTDWSTNSVVRANKFNGSDVHVIQKTITQPFDLQVIHPKRQPLIENPCQDNNGGCSHLCLLNVNQTVGCWCPHRKRLQDDGKTCKDDIKFLLFVKDHEIRGVDFEKADFNVIPVITIPHVDKPTSIDYDVNSSTLYWADKGLNVINKADFNANVETLIDKNLENPEGFAIDWLSKNMYFSSYNVSKKTGSISVATLAGSFRTEIINKDIANPHSIALHPLQGQLFYTDLYGEPNTHKLCKAYMDGSEHTVLLNNLNRPKSLTVDQINDRLYFINSGNNAIMSCTLSGSDVRVIENANISKPDALTIYKDLLYVAAGELIVSIKTDGTGYTKLRDSTPNVKALLPYDAALRSLGSGGPVNTCHGEENNCSQLCLPNSRLLSRCKCTDGYDLDKDLVTCVGITSFLLYAKETEIRGQKFNPKVTLEALPPISNIQSASAVDFHAELDMIYWVDNKANTISRIKRDLTERQVVLNESINSVEGIAVDWIAGNIYWTDAGHSTIEMSKLNGENRYVITSGDMDKPRSIVVDPVLGFLYWSDWGADASIERAGLDGSGRVNFLYTEMDKPWGLTIDYSQHVMYWCDYGLHTIHSVDLLSYKRNILIQESNSFHPVPISLTVFGDYLYWIDENLNGGSIYRATKADGGNITLIRSSLGGNLKDLKAFDKERQIGDNACKYSNGGCEELCFHQGNNQVHCACSYGKLAADNKTCDEYEGFIMFSKVTGIDSVNLENMDNKNPPMKHITDETFLRNVIGLAFDYSTKRIFYSDIQRGDIQKVGFDGSNIQVIVNGIGSAEGLAYESVHGDLYWTSYTNSCISRINVEKALSNETRKPDVVIQLSKLDHPRAIVVDSCLEFIYWTNWNTEKPRIQRSKLNGSHDENVIVEDILTPNGLTIDHVAKKLYWSDARLDKIERCDMDGSNRHVLLTSIPQHSFGLAVYGDFLFWTDWMLRAIIKVNKHDGTGIVWLRKNLERQPMGIIAVASDSNNCELNKCHGDKHGCQDLCFTDLNGSARCQCQYGRLMADGKTCAAAFNCSNENYEMFSCLSSTCLPFQKSCDGRPDCPDGSDEFVRVCANRECPPTMFACANRTMGQCIALSKKCDRQVDCRDESDEALDICDCPAQSFRCKSGNCIPKEFRCNGIGDCHDNSDELGCDAYKKCQTGFRACDGTGDCIPEEKFCDGKPDCANGTDEPVNCTVTCAPNMLQCDNKKQCYYPNWRCDKDQDCNDNSDEKDCKYTCKAYQFQCATGNHCIAENWVCDMHDDCGDGSDEENCDNQNCTDKFNCSAERCISMNWVCDGEPDCPDGKDESVESGCDPVECGPSEFQCANFRCIDIDYYCDQHDDCGDNSDEPENCKPHPVKCSDSQYQCEDRLCIDQVKHCDGHTDCLDGSDEKNCERQCGANFQCSNGVCIDNSLVCNWENDCGDYSDEPHSCGVNECTQFNSCSHKCTDKKIGFECSCNPGYKLRNDKTTCEDVDECATELPCSHFCSNTIGSYYCTCAEGYKMQPNQRGCTLDDNAESQHYLLLSNRHYIHKMSFEGNYTTLVSNLTYSVAIDFDYQEQMLYWTDIHSQSSTINRIPLNNTGNATQDKQVLHSSTVLNPDGMAVDWIGRNLYWCDRNTDTVEVSRLDGKFRKILVRDKTFLREPRALELFPKYGYLYLSDWGDEPHISRISMDGKIKEHIITDEVAWPNALTIDYVTEKIFWADANYDYIAMADLDGKNRHTIIREDLPHTFAITTFMDFIFWTDWESNGVFQAEKFSGERRTLLRSMTLRPMDIVVFHSLRQPKLANKANPCDALNCTHLCLLRPANGTSTVSAVCACPENHKLNEDGKSCTDDCTSSQFLCETSSRCIPAWWKCDNHTDCEDGSDEPDDCTPYLCLEPGLYQCKNATNSSHCIPPIGLCDGEPNCADASDETEWNNCTDYNCMVHQFKCKGDGKCISDMKLCDGTPDCSDSSDEANCKQQDCLESQFTCVASQKCIAYLWQCDGENDCLDWSDETNCEARSCKEDFMKCNKSNKCIPNQWECDGEHDCGEGDDTDEDPDKCSTVTCDANSFTCGNSHCIPLRWKCDGDSDCNDGKDEKDCPPKNCTAEEFQCDNGNKCIPLSSKCNGLNDCRDRTDEADCPDTSCLDGYFKCNSLPRCIPNSFKCDGHQQCRDGSDEENCPNMTCAANEFKCANSTTECLSMQWRCDGDYDCADKSDEVDCYKYACQYGRFRCSNHVCIPLYMVCDGSPDCSKEDDESPALCRTSDCGLGQYKCKDSSTCIKISEVCDGKLDCKAGDDEDKGELCSAANQSPCGIMNGGCQQNCTFFKPLKMHKCHCPLGQVLDRDEVSCVVDDPCRRWKTCPQKCENLGRERVHCSCYEGYDQLTLDSGEVVCRAIGSKPSLLVAWESAINEHKIHDPSADAETKLQTSQYMVDSVGIDMSFDSRDKWLLFIVYGSERMITKVRLSDSSISSVSKTGLEKPIRNTRDTGEEEVIVSGVGTPRQIAVDWIGKRLYWTDSSDRSIRMSNYDGKRNRTVVKDHVNEPFDIVVEPNIGKIFWTDHGYPPTIESANLDGSNRTVVVRHSILWPNGLAIDMPNSRLYWADTKRHTVETVRLDGSDRNLVRKFDGLDPPFKVQVFEDWLYVTTQKTNRVVKLAKFFDQKSNMTYLTDTWMPISDIIIMQEKIQQIQDPIRTNACSNVSKCMETQMCINNPAGPKGALYTCVCPDGAVASTSTDRCDFMKCQDDDCHNGGNCSVTYTGQLKCTCPRQFVGEKCDTDLCEQYCYSGGECSVTNTDPPVPTCKCPPGFSDKRCTKWSCSDYCKNSGNCSIDPITNQPICTCQFGYTGAQCEDHSHCDATQCKNNGTCSLRRGQLYCKCPPDYTGPRCDQCSQVTHFCYNGGVCVKDPSPEDPNPRCQCPEGYSARDNCQTRTCKDYCMHGSQCRISGQHIECICSAGYHGERCNETIKECTSDYCKNNGTCVSVNTIATADHVSCHCASGFWGPQCQNVLNQCYNFCQNGGTCTMNENSEPYCTCPEMYQGRTCEDCACSIQGECVKNKENKTMCRCTDVKFEGTYCNRSICHDYCYNEAECGGCHIDATTGLGQCRQCKCKQYTSGPRCHVLEQRPATQPQKASSLVIPVAVSVILALFILACVGLFIFIKKKRSRQFRHSRLKDGSNMQVANPIYMPQTTEDDEEEDHAHQPLDQPYDFDPEKSTNFANPVYEQFYSNDSRQQLLTKEEESDEEPQEKEKK